MSLGLPPVRETWHSSGMRLLRISPLSDFYDLPGTHQYYKIFGGDCIAAADYDLACLVTWLEDPRHPGKEGGIRQSKGVYQAVTRDLDVIIAAFDSSSTEKFLGESAVAQQRVETVKHYAQQVGLPSDSKTLQRRVCSYKDVLEQIKAGKKLSRAQESVRKEFIDFARFFKNLEQKYDSYHSHQQALVHEALE